MTCLTFVDDNVKDVCNRLECGVVGIVVRGEADDMDRSQIAWRCMGRSRDREANLDRRGHNRKATTKEMGQEPGARNERKTG